MIPTKLLPEHDTEIIINNIKLVIKHNDIGASIDAYPTNDQFNEPYESFQLLFDDFERLTDEG